MSTFRLHKALIFFFLLFSNFVSGKLFLSEDSWDQPKNHSNQSQLTVSCFSSRILKNKRDVWVYTPAGYEWKKGPYPLLIVFDGQAYTSQLIPGPTILDNLIAAGKIPPLVAVFISSVDQKTRNLELPCYSRFISSLTQELLPWVSRRYFITHDPAQTIIAGSSYGGLAAVFAALSYPQKFGNVLSQSGAFWWHPTTESASPWLIKQLESRACLPVRFYLDVGNQETEATPNQMSMVDVNRYLYKVLQEKGNKVTYYEFDGDHDYACWRKTFAKGLITLLGKEIK